MNRTRRPELGSRLDHLCIHSPDPLRVAQFYATAYAMRLTRRADGWLCEGTGRRLAVLSGTANTVRCFAYSFASRPALEAFRTALSTRAFTIGANVSPLFDDSAFALTDPDGNAVAFGVPANDRPGEDDGLPARLQHCAFRTAQLDAMVGFYQSVGFVVSDRVEDDDGRLRACFLRTDDEHHALALFGSPETRLDHLSCETRDFMTLVGWADRMASERIPIHWGVGRHGPGNDIFFMVKDPDDNLIEISAELEICAAERPAGRWRHEPRTLNLWGAAIMRS
jgi:catechol 2,3-dioxygenase